MNILVPMERLWTRFSKEGYKKPKPFLDIMWWTRKSNSIYEILIIILAKNV